MDHCGGVLRSGTDCERMWGMITPDVAWELKPGDSIFSGKIRLVETGRPARAIVLGVNRGVWQTGTDHWNSVNVMCEVKLSFQEEMHFKYTNWYQVEDLAEYALTEEEANAYNVLWNSRCEGRMK